MPDPTGRVSHLPHFHRGVAWKEPCRVATTANVTIATALNAGDSIDGVTLAAGDRVLVWMQSTGSQNGIYVAGASPARAYDMDQDGTTTVPAEEVAGAFVYVIAGTANAGKVFHTTNVAGATLGSTTITFEEFSSGGGSLDVTDGTTTVSPTTELEFDPASFAVTDQGGDSALVEFIGSAGGGSGTAFIGARALASATTSVTNSPSPFVAVAFAGTDSFDTDGFHDPASNNTRMTIPAGLGGKYYVSGTLYWDGNTSGERLLSLWKNGSRFYDFERAPAMGAQDFGGVIDLAAGDYVEVRAWQNSGGTRTIAAGGGGEFDWFAIFKIGSGGAGEGIGARATNTASTSIANNTPTAMPFATEAFDTDGFHDNSTNNTRMTIPAGLGGKYIIVGQYTGSATNVAHQYALIRKNGSSDWGFSRGGPVASFSAGINVSTIVDLAAGDYVELIVYQNSGAGDALEPTAGYNWLSIMRLDSGTGDRPAKATSDASADTGTLTADTETDMPSCSISLTVGNWLIGGVACSSSGTATYILGVITDASNNHVSMGRAVRETASPVSIPIPVRLVSPATTTTYKLRVQAGASSGTFLRYATGTTPGTAIWAMRVA